MGTVLEVTYLVFEVPTGIVADAVSRKGSIFIGFMGTEVRVRDAPVGGLRAWAPRSRSRPSHLAGPLGVSATFISGADVAWLTDEVGEDAARPLYVERAVLERGRARSRRAWRSPRSRCRSPIVMRGIGSILTGLASPS